MAGHTIKNLKRIEDSAVKFGLSPGLEARFARDELATEQSALSFQRLAPNFRQPFGHRHERQEEVYVVLAGSGRIKLDDEILELEQWDSVRISPATTRQVEAGPDGLEILVFGAPSLGENPRGDVEGRRGWWAE